MKMILKTKILETIPGEIVGALKNFNYQKSQHKNKMTQKAMGDFGQVYPLVIQLIGR
jgi:hypothetical protein